MNSIFRIFRIYTEKVKRFLKLPPEGVPKEDEVVGVKTTLKQFPTRKEFLLFVLVSFLVFAFVLVWLVFPRVREKKGNANERATLLQEVQGGAFVSPFQNLSLHAHAVYVLDAKNKKVLFAKNENSTLPLASLTKIMTMLEAYEILPQNTVIKITKEAIAMEGETGLLLDEKWELNNLIDLSLVTSSNDGAHALASEANLALGLEVSDENSYPTYFIDRMNEKAKELGLFSMYFNNETGLDLNQYESGGYSSARDVANLFSYVLEKYPFLLEATKYQTLSLLSYEKKMHEIKNTSTALNAIPALIASKTGFTDLAGGNLVVAFDAGVNFPVVIVVLGSTYDGRFEDVLQLSRATLRYIEHEE